MTEYIKFLRNVSCPKAHIEYCGDRCCSWLEWENENFLADEEVENDENEIDISALEVGVDYEIIQQ